MKNDLVLIGYRHPSVKLYNPKRNKKRLGFIGGICVLCLITPMTNWILFPMFKILNKYPIWLYR